MGVLRPYLFIWHSHYLRGGIRVISYVLIVLQCILVVMRTWFRTLRTRIAKVSDDERKVLVSRYASLCLEIFRIGTLMTMTYNLKIWVIGSVHRNPITKGARLWDAGAPKYHLFRIFFLRSLLLGLSSIPFENNGTRPLPSDPEVSAG